MLLSLLSLFVGDVVVVDVRDDVYDAADCDCDWCILVFVVVVCGVGVVVDVVGMIGVDVVDGDVRCCCICY